MFNSFKTFSTDKAHTNALYDTANANGRIAYGTGQSLVDCPYDSENDPIEHTGWCRGYVEAEIDTIAEQINT